MMPSQIKADDVIRVVQMQGKRVLDAHVVSKDEPSFHVRFPQNGSAPVYKVEICGNLISEGTINGEVVCHGWIDCADIAGDVHADGDVRANGIYAVGDVTCNQIVECYNLKCKTVVCSGDIHTVNLICENKSP
jgi:cytoskeletal protein CcmA (bactofilin family)